MIVLDASVIVSMLVYPDDRGRKVRQVVARDIEWVAPEHWKVEVFSALRGLVLGGKLAQGDGASALDRMRRLGMETIPVDRLLDRMWQLRSSFSGYDAAYVVLAGVRRLTLVTADARLARAASSHCRVELAG
jgi:predicted nucleic acid-binding protein